MSLIDYFATNIVPKMYRGKGALHPAPTGKLTNMVSCVREYDVNIFFIRKNGMLIAVDAGYKNYRTFRDKCDRIGINPLDVQALFLTHADPDHAGGLDISQTNHFQNAEVYLGEVEENYLTNTYHRKQIGPFGLKNSVSIKEGYHLLRDGEITRIGDLKVQAFLVPGHTLGHLAYLIDDEILFTGDSIALNKDGGWCFFDIFNYKSSLNIESLKALKSRLDLSRIRWVFTSHNGFTGNVSAAFKHIDVIPGWKQKGFVFDDTAPYDCFTDEEKMMRVSAKEKSRKYFNEHRKSKLARGGYWRHDYRYALSAIGKIHPKRLIDIGCGPGAFLTLVQKKYPEIQLNALDLSEEMAAETRGRLLPTAIVTVGDSENMPLADSQYQAVTCNMSIHHYPHPQKAVNEMYRILTDGGCLLLNDMDCAAPIRWCANRIFPHLPGGDVKMYNRAEIMEMVKQAGFKEIEYRKISPFSFQCIAVK